MFVSADRYIPQCAPQSSRLRRRSFIVWSVVAVGALLIVSLLIAAPLALSHQHNFLALMLYQTFSHVCHQMPERSFYIEGQPYAVCARCTGLYVGLAFGALLYPLARSLRRRDTPARAWLIVAAAPTIIDFALNFFGLWSNTHLSRLMTGALLGAVSAFYVIPGLVDLSQIDWRRFLARPAAPLDRDTQAAAYPPNDHAALSDYSSPWRRI